MNNVITKKLYSHITGTDLFRPIDLFLVESVNFIVHSLTVLVNRNQDALKKPLSSKMEKKLAEIVVFNSYEFIEESLKSENRCLYEKKADAAPLFNEHYFKSGNFSKADLPEALQNMTKMDFFLFEYSIGVADRITTVLKGLYPDVFLEYIYSKIIGYIVKFYKESCEECHSACHNDPAKDLFKVRDCICNSRDCRSYEEIQKKYSVGASIQKVS